MELVDVNIKTEKFAELIRDGKRGSYEGNLKIGVDLGTANIFIAVVDMNDEPVAGVSREAKVICNVVEAAGFLVTEVVGACSFERFESVFEKYLKINIVNPNNPLLITPLGIAMYSK